MGSKDPSTARTEGDDDDGELCAGEAELLESSNASTSSVTSGDVAEGGLGVVQNVGSEQTSGVVEPTQSAALAQGLWWLTKPPAATGGKRRRSRSSWRRRRRCEAGCIDGWWQRKRSRRRRSRR